MMKVSKRKMQVNGQGRRLNNSEIKQFEIECPACGIIVNLSEFSNHLKKDINIIKNKYNIN